jgi:hypothetical protein
MPVVTAIVVVLLAACETGQANTSRAATATNSATATNNAGGTGGAAAAGAFSPRAENTRPGSDCGLTRLGENHALEGWLDRVSISPGQPVRLYASTTAARLTISAFRVGWYGGRGCRLVATYGPLPGRRQAPATVERETKTVTTAWTPTDTFDTASWPPGDYLFRLDDSDGLQSYVPLTVRAPSARGAVVIVNAVTTWQAYNAWGGYSLYHGMNGYADRARIVSFDRPYDFGDGAADFTGNEAPLVMLAEKLGLPLDYITDIDLHADPGLLAGARAVISLGHDEYYSPAMRAALERARDAGVNLAFLGANAVYRRIRLAASPYGPDRRETDYKDPAEDPLDGVDDAHITANWPSPPDARPESSLTGGMYQCNPVHADLVVTNPSHWLLAGTHTAVGTRVPGMIGSEYDRVDLSYPTPQDIEVLAHSPVTCQGRADHSDVSYYTAPSGAGVFDAGTSAWICGINNVCGAGAGGPVMRAFVTAVTATMLTTFAHGPAGQAHPAARSVPPDDHFTSAGTPER